LALIQTRFKTEDLEKQTLESTLEDAGATNQRLQTELEGYKKLLEQTREGPKTLYVDSAKQKEVSDESLHSLHSTHSAATTHSTTRESVGRDSQGSVLGSLRRSMSKRRSRADLTMPFSVSEVSLQFNAVTIEGVVKVPKEGRIRNGWVKKYLVVKDYNVLLFDKEKDKGSVADAKLLAEVRWPIFVCKEATEASVHAKKEDLPLIFVIQARSSAVTTEPSSADQGLNVMQIQSKMKSVEKEIEIEEGIHTGFEKMAKVTKKKEVQQQLDGSRKKLEQLKHQHAKLSGQVLEATARRERKIKQAEENISSEEKYNVSLKNLLELADTEEEKKSTTSQIDESEKKIEELRKIRDDILNYRDTAPSEGDVQLREFNGHKFKTTTFDLDVYCQQCSKLLLNRQGLACTRT